ncbi:MAG: hypothetical protein AAF745_15115 [Planctomycetota bacterium]
MELAAVALAWPRMEWPFLIQWCQHLGQHGVRKVFLGEHWRSDRMWDKKPNAAYYHPHLDDRQINRAWREAIDIAERSLAIDRIPLPARLHRMGELQRWLFGHVHRFAQDESIDWVLSCDLDEFPIPGRGMTLREFLIDLRWRRKQVAELRFKQIIFESRWDVFNDFQPRDLAMPSAYHPTVIPVTKYLYRPGHVYPSGAHRGDVVDPESRSTIAPANRILLHHFRGIETACRSDLAVIQNLPCRASEPLKSVPFTRMIGSRSPD